MGFVRAKSRKKNHGRVGADARKKCLEIVHTYELSQTQDLAIGTQATPKALDTLYNARGHSCFRTKGCHQFTSQATQTDSKQGQGKQHVQYVPKCQNCRYNKHTNMSQCPAKGKLCHKCSNYNHFANLCKSVKSVLELVNSEYVCVEKLMVKYRYV